MPDAGLGWISTTTASSSASGSSAPGSPGEAFARVRLVDVELVRCDLSGCDFSEAVLHRVTLVDCRCVGRSSSAVGRCATSTFATAGSTTPTSASRSSRRCASTDRTARAADFGGARLDDGRASRGSDLTGADFSTRALRATVDLRGRAPRRAARASARCAGATIGLDQLFGLAPGLAAARGPPVLADDENDEPRNLR